MLMRFNTSTPTLGGDYFMPHNRYQYNANAAAWRSYY